jgi:addiction module HigA family antidote
MSRLPKNRASAHPGEMLLEEFLLPMGLTQKELANAIRVPFQRINEIVSGKRGLTPSTALRLAKYFGMSPGFWLNLQMKRDIYFAEQKERDVLKMIKPVRQTTV